MSCAVPWEAGLARRLGRTAVLGIGGVEVVVMECCVQPLDVALLQSVGIEPARRRLIALKSSVHFRSTYQEIAGRIFDADTPGVHRPESRRPDLPAASPAGVPGRRLHA